MYASFNLILLGNRTKLILQCFHTLRLHSILYACLWAFSAVFLSFLFFTLFLDFDSPSNYSNVMSIKFSNENRLTHCLLTTFIFSFLYFRSFCVCRSHVLLQKNVMEWKTRNSHAKHQIIIIVNFVCIILISYLLLLNLPPSHTISKWLLIAH